MTETENIFKQNGEVVLRPIEKDDAEFLQELTLHPDVRDTLGRPPMPVNKKEEEDYIEKISSDDGAAHFLIEFQGERAGHISLHGLENDYGRGEFGISIHADHHGKGIGTKSVQMLVEYAFETQNLHKVRGGFIEGNKASKRVMEKAGFQQEGQERDYKYVNGEWKDVVWMSILETEYKPED